MRPRRTPTWGTGSRRTTRGTNANPHRGDAWGGAPGGAPRPGLDGTISAIILQLNQVFGAVVPPNVISQSAFRAVQDLLGSICIEALPEMAVRLATVRLQTRVEPGPSTP